MAARSIRDLTSSHEGTHVRSCPGPRSFALDDLPHRSQQFAALELLAYAIDALKPGEPVKVVYLRQAERRETLLTPAVRN